MEHERLSELVTEILVNEFSVLFPESNDPDMAFVQSCAMAKLRHNGYKVAVEPKEVNGLQGWKLKGVFYPNGLPVDMYNL